MSDDGEPRLPTGDCGPECPHYHERHFHGGVHHMEPMTLGPELSARLAAARAEWARLKAAGTPYWCVHKGREVNHERAYFKPETRSGPAFDGVHAGHGVMCADCGGYIQEG